MILQPVASPGFCTTLQSTQNTRSAAGRRWKSSWGTVSLKRLNGECKSSWPFSEPFSLPLLPGWGREKFFFAFCHLVEIGTEPRGRISYPACVCMCVCVCVCTRACALSYLSCVRLCATIWTIAPPGSSVHRLLQARILEWIAMPSFRGSSQPREWICVSYVSCTGRQVLYH